MTTTPTPHRCTTREVAILLHCSELNAVCLLKAAGVPHTRCGPAYLWDAAEVERLAETLRKPAAAPAAGQAVQR